MFENKGSTGAPSLFNDNPQEEEDLFKKQPLGLKKEISTYPGASGEQPTGGLFNTAKKPEGGLFTIKEVSEEMQSKENSKVSP